MTYLLILMISQGYLEAGAKMTFNQPREETVFVDSSIKERSVNERASYMHNFIDIDILDMNLVFVNPGVSDEET